MRPWLVSLTCCLHLFTQKRTYPVESSVSALQLLTLDSRCCIPLHNCLYLQLLTLDSSLDLIWAAQQHFVCFQQVSAWTDSWWATPSQPVNLRSSLDGETWNETETEKFSSMSHVVTWWPCKYCCTISTISVVSHNLSLFHIRIVLIRYTGYGHCRLSPSWWTLKLNKYRMPTATALWF